nr:hypothetical protein [Gammaproteobacteria bacterium]
QEGVVSAERIDSLLRLFDTALEALDHAAVRRLLLESVQGYAPRNGIEDHVWLEQDKILAAETASSSVH